MLTIDGSFGEGGGQIIRSALALSLVTRKPITINHIRANRNKPGLRRQHLTAVRAAAKIGQANVEGAELGSSRFVFIPGEIVAGDYHFRIGTAGSTTLVLQTLLPALWIADGPSSVILEGGTHNPMAPPFEFLAKTYLPLVSRMGPHCTATLNRPGFYPAGGGAISVDIKPSRKFHPLELLEQGKLLERRVCALVAKLPREIAERECKTIARKSGWGKKCFSVEERSDSLSPGNAILIELIYENIVEVFVGFGKRGVKAEDVASGVLKEAQHYLKSEAPVGEHLADQLMLPLGMGAHLGDGGGAFKTATLSSHAKTQLEVLQMFLDIHVSVEKEGENYIVQIASEKF